MGRKKRSASQGQVIGITCLLIGLAIITGVIIFYSHRTEPALEEVQKRVEEKAFLEKKEDSVYAVRRQKRSEKRVARTLDSSYYTTQAPKPMRQPLMVELNTADTTTLQLLHGIGPAYARRIVRYRERLGGFVRLEQLEEVYGITPELVAHLAPHLQIDTAAVQRIRINEAELKRLVKHPYMEYYQARDIVVLRKKGVRFASVDDLRAVPSMADSTLQRLLPYLDFN